MAGRVYLPGRKNGRGCPEGIVTGWVEKEGRRGRGGSGCLTVFSGFEESVGGCACWGGELECVESGVISFWFRLCLLYLFVYVLRCIILFII